MSDSSRRYTLTVQLDGEALTFTVGPDPVVIGRVVPDGVAIDHTSISRRHCELTFEEGEFEVKDLASSNGTFVNGNQIIRSKASVGDQLRFGQVEATLTPLADVTAQAERESAAIDPGEIELDEISLDDEPVSRAPRVQPKVVAAAVDDVADDFDEISLGDDEPVGESTGWVIVASESGERFPLESRPLTIGRSASNDLVLKGLGVSGKHGEVEWRGNRPVLRDLGSTNGVLVDGRRVETVDLYDGTRFQIGKVAVSIEGPIQAPARVAGVEEISLEDDEDIAAADQQPQLHQLVDADVPKRSRAGLIAIPLLLVGIAGAGYFYFRPPAAVGTSKTEAVEAPNDSLIQAGFSAEEGDAADAWTPVLVGAGSDFARVAGAKRRGRFGFELTRSPKAPADQPTIAFYREPIAVDSRRRYTIEAYARQADGTAAAALLVQFLDADGGVIGEQLSQPVDSGSFEAIEISPTVPYACSKARVGMVAIGGGGIVHCDDVTMRPSDLAPQVAEHGAGRFNIRMAPSGAFSVRDESAWVLRRVEYFVVANKARHTLGFATTAVSATSTDQKTGVDATLTVGAVAKPVSVTLEGADPVRVRYSGWDGTGAQRDGVRMNLRASDLAAGMLVIAGGSVAAVSGSFAIEACEAIVIGEGPRAVRLEFQPPMDLEVRKQRDSIVAEFTRAFDGGKPIAVEVRTSLIDLMAAATTALARGRESLARNDYGAAFRQLQQVTDRFAVKKTDIEEAQRLLTKVERDFDERRKALGKRVDQAIFFKDERQIDGLLRDARALADAYRDTKAYDSATELAEKLTAAKTELTTARTKEYAEPTLELARDFKERGSVHFAERYFTAVIERCKGTEWAEAATKELAELRKVVKELK